MLTNSQMKPNRFGKLADAKQKLKWIQDGLSCGMRLTVSSRRKITIYDSRHIDQFKATKTGVYAQYDKLGKKWGCIDNCSISFSK